MRAVNFYLKKLEDFLESYLVDKAPAISTHWKRIIVQILPWIILLFLLFFLPILLIFFGISTFLLSFSFNAGWLFGVSYFLAMFILVIAIILTIIAIPGLFKNSQASWNLLFKALILVALFNILSFNILGLIIFSILPLYLLFQIKDYFRL